MSLSIDIDASRSNSDDALLLSSTKSKNIRRSSTMGSLLLWKEENDSKFNDAIDKQISEEMSSFLSMEETRVGVRKFMFASTPGRIYNETLLFISIASSIEFIYQTYLDPINDATLLGKLNYGEKGLAILFMFDWCLNFYTADHKLKFISSFFSMVDILTVIPIWATTNQTQPIMDEVQTLDDGIMYILFLLNTTRVLRALRINRKLANIKDAVDRSMGDIILVVTMMILFFAAVMQFLEESYQSYSYHTWMYYVLVTITTVGYGDIFPLSLLGRIAAMMFIGFAIITIPKLTNDLVENMALQSIYARMAYRSKGKASKHIIICGDLSSTSLSDFFEELFHEDHENYNLHVVILLPDPPNVDMILLLRDPKYVFTVNYLEGSALLVEDLRRAKIEIAEAVFIMTNKFSLYPDEEDAKTILHSLSIQRYIKAYKKTGKHATDLKLLYCMQIIRPDNLRLLSQNDEVDLDPDHVVICLNEIKMGILAMSLIYPGANTFIMNLITTSADGDDDDDDEGEGGNLLNESVHGSNPKLWIKEYTKGCDWEIYVTPLADIFIGGKFSEVSYLLYDKHGVVLFALKVVDLDHDNLTRIFLNPADYRIPPKEKFTVEAFVMAKNKADSDLSNDRFKKSSGPSTMPGLGGALKTIDSTQNKFRERAKSTFYAARAAVNPAGKVESTAGSDSETGATPATVAKKKPVGKKNLWNLLKRNAIVEKKVQAMSRQEIVQELEDAHVIQNYYIRAFPPELRDVTVRTSLLDEYPEICNHLIITGKGLASLFDLIRPLRSKHLGKMQHIIILAPDDIPYHTWQKIKMFDGILFIRGTPLEESNLRRAGIIRASKVLILADGIAADSENGTGREALVDSDAIFSYQCANRMNPFAHVVVEIVHHSNISYLDIARFEGAAVDNYKCTPQFAAGTLFNTSLLDSLVSQAYFNPLIIQVVNRLVSGIDHLDRSELNLRAAKREAQDNGKGKDDGSSDSDDDNKTGKPDKKRSLKSTLVEMKGSCLYQVPISENFVRQKYGELFKNLSAQGIIPLGLLRCPSANVEGLNEFDLAQQTTKQNYVYTNPDKDTTLRRGDKVFCLATKPVRSFENPLAVVGSPGSAGRGQSPKLNKRSTTIYGAPSLGRRSRVASAANSQEMKFKHLETKLHSMTSEVSVKLNDIYKLVDQLVAASQEDDVFPSTLNSGTVSPASRRDKLVKDVHGRKYSTTSNMTTETVETACESENRDEQQKHPHLQGTATSVIDLTANLAVPDSPPAPDTAAELSNQGRSNTPPPVVIVHSGSSNERDANYPRDVSNNGHSKPRLNVKGIVLGPSIQSVSNLSFLTDKFKANLSSHFHADMRQTASVSAFPNISGAKKVTSPKSQSSILQQQLRDASPTREKNQFNRLSGLRDTSTSNGLYSEIVRPIKPSTLCVRCGAYASICMPCSDQVCEDTLTFYRKTRASGAVALFTKAFVEAGNSKLVKFFMFRLWKNSLQKNQKQQLKMKSVVERLFGSNVVYLPFAAWKKYTKENIMDRKNTMLHKLKDKNELLETQVLKIAAVNTVQEAEIRNLRAELTKCKAENEASSILIKNLQSNLKEERHRVVGISSVLNPLAENWKLLDKLIEATTAQVRTLLIQSGQDIPSYDYSHVFTDEVVRNLQVMGSGEGTTTESSASLSASSLDNYPDSENRRAYAKKVAEQAVGNRIILDWINAESLRADAHIDPHSGAPLSKFLPAHDDSTELFNLSNGKNFCRVVVGVIYEKIKEHERLMTSRAATPGEGSRSLRHFFSAGRPKPLSAVELHTIKGLHENPFDLITLTLKFATERLLIPAMKVTDIFAGRTDFIYTLCVALMVLSVPTMEDEAIVAVNLQIQSFQHLMLSANREREQERERGDDDSEGTEGTEDGEGGREEAYLEYISKINNLQEMFDLGAKEKSSDLYPQLAHKDVGHAAKLFMQTVVSVSETTFNEDGPAIATSVTRGSVSEGDNASHRRRGMVVANGSSGGGAIMTNATVYKALTTEVDLLLAKVSRASQPLQHAVKSKESLMEQLIHLEHESIRLRELRDDGMRLTTNLRQLVLSNLINHTVVN